jgi:hypothetical protein
VATVISTRVLTPAKAILFGSVLNFVGALVSSAVAKTVGQEIASRDLGKVEAFTWQGRMRLRNARWAEDPLPLDQRCDCYTCGHFSRGVLRHLFMASEMLGPTLLTIHNLHFFASFMAAIRRGIAAGDLEAKARQWTDAIYAQADDAGAEG